MSPEVRLADEADLAFIYQSWLKSLRVDSHYKHLTTKATFFTNYRLILDEILSESMILVACLPEDHNVILAYLCYSGDTLHYAFCKEAFRNLGITRMLYKEAFKNKPVITHYTYSSDPIIQKHNLEYNPFLIFKGVSNES